MADSNRPTVLVVDDNTENIKILLEVLQNEYKVKAATGGIKALAIAKATPRPDIILLDIMMPDMNGYEVCRTLKSDETTASIPVIFVTSMTDIGDEEMGFSVGGVDYITKPILPKIVQARVRTHLAMANQQRACEQTVEKQVALIRRGQNDAIHMLGQAGHYNDDDTGVHIWRMANYTKCVAKACRWSVKDQNTLLMAAPMHDTGKIGIPDAILKKPGKLTDEEWITMRTHTTIGHKILSLSSAPVFVMGAAIALSHHERWDGTGYPNQLRGEDIPMAARIVALADVFDALTMARPYKKEWETSRALEYIFDNKGHFDPKLCKVFKSVKDEIVSIKEYWNKKVANMQETHGVEYPIVYPEDVLDIES